MKPCPDCGSSLPASSFHRSATSPDGHIRDDADLLYMLSEYLEAPAFEPPLPEPPERRRVPREPVAA